MPFPLNHEPLDIKSPVQYDPVILEFTADLRRRGEVAESRVRHDMARARHFLIWLARRGLSLEAVDATVIDRFLRHDCDCREAGPAAVWLIPWRKRRTSPELMRFIRFLERTGRIPTPGELEDNFRLLETFLEGLGADGYVQEYIRQHRGGCVALIEWLHLSRIPLCDLTPDVYARFRKRRLTCSLPGAFGPRKTHSRGGTYDVQVRRFLRHLAALGRIAPLEPVPEPERLSEPLETFALWLERCRGVTPATVRRYIRLIAPVLPVLGDDPRAYDTAQIRGALLQCLERRTRDYAKELANAMRMYLRCLAWDIVALRLGDIDWDSAEVRVAGKTGRHDVLPLPQDAGDALRAYIATVRPRVDEQKVFLCMMAPYRAFSSGTVVSYVARRALNRAGITGLASRGAHVFRHSQATALLRSGATFDTVQSLLRHRSRESTLIYAKTDAVMLQEVAQPWMGGVQE